MRLRIEGRCDYERLWREVKRFTEWLDDYGIKEVRGVNLYFTALHPETGEEVVLMREGKATETISFSPPKKPKAIEKKKKIQGENVIQLPQKGKKI